LDRNVENERKFSLTPSNKIRFSDLRSSGLLLS